MTPKHQRIIDEVLLATAERTRELMMMMSYSNEKDRSIENLHQSKLGNDLEQIAEYAEGHGAPSLVVQAIIERVYRVLFGHPLGNDYILPKDFQKTQLGELIQEANTRIAKARSSHQGG